jgi:hypothetical protein
MTNPFEVLEQALADKKAADEAAKAAIDSIENRIEFEFNQFDIAKASVGAESLAYQALQNAVDKFSDRVRVYQEKTGIIPVLTEESPLSPITESLVMESSAVETHDIEISDSEIVSFSVKKPSTSAYNLEQRREIIASCKLWVDLKDSGNSRIPQGEPCYTINRTSTELRGCDIVRIERMFKSNLFKMPEIAVYLSTATKVIKEVIDNSDIDCTFYRRYTSKLSYEKIAKKRQVVLTELQNEHDLKSRGVNHG